MNTDKLAINWQYFDRVRLEFKFTFIIRVLIFYLKTDHMYTTKEENLYCLISTKPTIVQQKRIAYSQKNMWYKGKIPSFHYTIK